MKGDDRRAEQLATALDGGPVADEIDALLPAVNRLRELLRRLGPDPDHLTALLPGFSDRLLAASRRPVVELAHPTLYVRDMDAALAFYRDVLGLQAREQGAWFSMLESGGAMIALHWTGSAKRAPQVGDIRIDFHTNDLDRLAGVLLEHGLTVDVKTDRTRGRFIELRDPDGYAIVVRGAPQAG